MLWFGVWILGWAWVSLAPELLGPGFCGGLVYGLGRIVGSDGFSAQFIEVIYHCRGIGCGFGVLRWARPGRVCFPL